MKKSFFYLILILINLHSCCEMNDGTYDIRCENLTNPLGIATDAPRFSWKVRSLVNDDYQTAYRIMAASSLSLLEEGKADLWDSGKTESQESVLVSYSGAKLLSGTVAYWKVQVWNKDGKAFPWSEPAHFSIGLLNPDDWSGKYIGLSQKDGDQQCPLLRKQFNLTDASGTFLLHVNSLGYHEIYVNGKKVGDYVLVPAVSQFNKRSLVVTCDVSEYVRKGHNDLVVWLGKGWYHTGLPGVVYDGPAVRAQLEQVSNKKRNILLVTDESWQTRESGYSDLGTGKAWNFGGEKIDASIVPASLSSAELEKLTWKKAAVIDIPKHSATPQMTESNRIMETIKPVSLTRTSEGVWLADMGKALTGWVEIKFPKLQAGQEIVLEYCDHLKEGKFVKQKQKDLYIASGKTDETFCNKFNYHSFRYLEISGLQQIETENISGMLIYTAYHEASSFACSDEDMNAIHNLVQRALKCLSLGGYLVDCNHIERLGYGGDGHASTITAQTMFDLAPLYANWLQAWKDCIREDGGLPHTAPNPYPAGGGPYWCAFIVTAPWNAYIHYGDRSFLEKYYPVMKHWIQYVDKYTVDGLLKRWPDTDYRNWYLGDWATPKGVNQTDEKSVDIVNNCAVSECYIIMEKIARLLGKNDEANEFSERKSKLNKRIQEAFFDETTFNYASGAQIDLVYPMIVEATPLNSVENVTKRLLSETEEKYKGHFATGLAGVPTLVEWAVRQNHPDFIYSMLKKRDYPGYLYMIDNGATATWEHWDGDRSHIHNCYNGIGAWFYQAIGGIRTDENAPAGYKHIIINPQIPHGVTWAKTAKDTPYGAVSVNWQLNHDVLDMEIIIPFGCVATVIHPQNANKYSLSSAVKQTGKEKQIKLKSGKYKITYFLTFDF
ncbi:MAG: glycoside hydrolase family 78 protein [Prevotellaceae bacterium]|jgi:alpha-L-rhamnosidase|nr:glycoside hydrolase family 78 protein [Prevotellaceae bacterium]